MITCGLMGISVTWFCMEELVYYNICLVMFIVDRSINNNLKYLYQGIFVPLSSPPAPFQGGHSGREGQVLSVDSVMVHIAKQCVG